MGVSTSPEDRGQGVPALETHPELPAPRITCADEDGELGARVVVGVVGVSLAVIVKVDAPLAVGVLEISAVDASSVKPGGSDPALTDHVLGPPAVAKSLSW
jgi:hypothetical protein